MPWLEAPAIRGWPCCAAAAPSSHACSLATARTRRSSSSSSRNGASAMAYRLVVRLRRRRRRPLRPSSRILCSRRTRQSRRLSKSSGAAHWSGRPAAIADDKDPRPLPLASEAPSPAGAQELPTQARYRLVSDGLRYGCCCDIRQRTDRPSPRTKDGGDRNRAVHVDGRQLPNKDHRI